MHLGLRLFFGFLVITGLAAFFVMRVFVAEVKPSVREVMEDILVDTANLLAEDAAADLAAMPTGGDLRGSRFAGAVQAYAARPVDAQIWGLHKRRLDLRIYVTDAQGRVVLDAGTGANAPGALGRDYSRWRDVALTLRGEYGARATREVQTDEASSVMYVAAPVRGPAGELLGVLTVAKAQSTVAPFIERAERKILVAGAWLLGLSLAIGVAVTLWAVWAVRRLRRYAQQAGADAASPSAPPQLPGELGELARAMGAMRERLDDRAQREQFLRALTHELKGPLAAIRGAAELLEDPALTEADRARFGAQVGEQVERLRELVDRLLELSKLESPGQPLHREVVELGALTDRVLADHAAALQQHGLALRWLVRDEARVSADPAQLALALSNLLANAIDFAPAGSALELQLRAGGGQARWVLRDHGPGVPGYALPHLGERFFATARPGSARKGSGLGLAIVRQVMALHGGALEIAPATPGLQVTLRLPLA
ncbi:two-component system sensor histidine kinase CreC [Ideonella sp.]|uniref:two-component system sensor histidine kinase CreC n=1 Tax=Ideonella sp. TaxID=1929293 RepID=UPI002B4A0480|nr:two-component system sensor histidine kinase CreC [Ideonella sp.]HJV72045.1 two-component system sensor histidine kinase CreC [Ideonella sp.]